MIEKKKRGSLDEIMLSVMGNTVKELALALNAPVSTIRKIWRDGEMPALEQVYEEMMQEKPRRNLVSVP